MPRNDFAAIRTWVFDLDNTLYPPEMALFSQIERRMTDWVMAAIGVERDQADRLRRDYWARYGTTLAGLMAEHDVDPAPYLSHVHDIDLDHVVADPDLTAALTALPGRKIVYTNGSSRYGLRVLEARGLGAVFDAVYGVEHATDGVTPGKAAMFEDDPRNLAAPHDMGMRTVHVAPEPVVAEHIHYHTDDLASFLRTLTEPETFGTEEAP